MKAAIYCRLSKEDEELEKDGSGRESESIQNQKSMLIHYAVEKGYDIRSTAMRIIRALTAPVRLSTG